LSNLRVHSIIINVNNPNLKQAAKEQSRLFLESFLIQEPALLQFDIYSCAPFNVEDVIQHLQKFQLSELQWIRIDRNNGLNVTDQGELEFITDEYDDMKTNFDEFLKNYN